jgi:hypothetical protein
MTLGKWREIQNDATLLLCGCEVEARRAAKLKIRSQVKKKKKVYRMRSR